MNKFEKARYEYAQDLRRLRKLRGISLDTVHAETRIIKTVLKEYETNCLYNNQNFHKIYLQSMTQAYAKAVDLDVDQVLRALQMALDGTYDGSLNSNVQSSVEESEPPAKESAKSKEPTNGASSSSKDESKAGG